jgi:hypothetical protein
MDDYYRGLNFDIPDHDLGPCANNHHPRRLCAYHNYNYRGHLLYHGFNLHPQHKLSCDRHLRSLHHVHLVRDVVLHEPRDDNDFDHGSHNRLPNNHLDFIRSNHIGFDLPGYNQLSVYRGIKHNRVHLQYRDLVVHDHNVGTIYHYDFHSLYYHYIHSLHDFGPYHNYGIQHHYLHIRRLYLHHSR